MLVGIDLILSYRDEILHRITDAHSVLQLPILLHFDRDCLEQTLPQCEAFDFLIRRLENQVDQHGGVVLRCEHVCLDWNVRELLIDKLARLSK